MNSITTKKLDIAYDNALIVENLDMVIPHKKSLPSLAPTDAGNPQC